MTRTEDDVASFVSARWQALVRYGFMLTGDRAAGEDLVQEALLRCLPSWGRLDPHGVEAYVRKVMARLAWKAHRHPLQDGYVARPGRAHDGGHRRCVLRAVRPATGAEGLAAPTAGRSGPAVLAGPQRSRDRRAARVPTRHGEEPRKPCLCPAATGTGLVRRRFDDARHGDCERRRSMNHPADNRATLLRERLDRLASSVSAGGGTDGAQLYRRSLRTPAPTRRRHHGPGRRGDRTRRRGRCDLAAGSGDDGGPRPDRRPASGRRAGPRRRSRRGAGRRR